MKKRLLITLTLGLLLPGFAGAMNTPKNETVLSSSAKTEQIKIKTTELITWVQQKTNDLERTKNLENSKKNEPKTKKLPRKKNFKNWVKSFENPFKKLPKWLSKKKKTQVQIKTNSNTPNYKKSCKELQTKINEIEELTKENFYQLKFNSTMKNTTDKLKTFAAHTQTNTKKSKKITGNKESTELTNYKIILALAKKELKNFKSTIENPIDNIQNGNYAQNNRKKNNTKKPKVETINNLVVTPIVSNFTTNPAPKKCAIAISRR